MLPTLIIFLTVAMIIMFLKPTLDTLLWYYDKRLEQVTRGHQSLVQHTRDLEKALATLKSVAPKKPNKEGK